MKLVLATAVITLLLCGCSTNPVTGRDQMVAFPAVQTHADVGFVLSKSAKHIAEPAPCDDSCKALDQKFRAQVAQTGKTLEEAARNMSPELFERIEGFSISVDADLDIATASSAGGRIALGAGIARLEPNDDVTAFLIAREMAHVIARHDEEDSGARIFFSAVTALLPIAMVARLIASALGSGAMMGSWASEQRREADEIALALLVRSGRSVAGVARSLDSGLKKHLLTDDGWAARYAESAGRVAAVAQAGPEHADFDDWLMHESVLSIERIATCMQARGAGQTLEEILARRRDCMDPPA